MARQGLRGAWLIGVAATLLWGVLTVIDLSPAEARTGGARGGFHGGFGGGGFRSGFHTGFATGFHGGFTHPFAFNHGFVVNRTFVTNRVFVRDRFFFDHFHRPFHRNVFFFNVGIGGFWPIYPVAYPYPAYYPYYYPYYSPCGYYDAYGTWVNAPCPPYDPSASAPY